MKKYFILAESNGGYMFIYITKIEKYRLRDSINALEQFSSPFMICAFSLISAFEQRC